MIKMRFCAKSFAIAILFLPPFAYASSALDQSAQPWSQPAMSDVVVEFKSVPPNAKVDVDGKYICDTPCSRALKPGTHKVVFRLDGYLPDEREVEVKDGMLPVIALLVKNVGWLSVNTSVPGIRILIDKKPVGNTPIEKYEVSAGAHEVSVDDPRASPLVEIVTVEAGEIKSIELAPIIKMGALYVKAVDDKNNALAADIFVDGALAGRAYQSIPLIVGKHKVRAEHKELASWQEEVEIEEAKSTTVQLRLGKAQEILKKGALFVETVDKDGNKPAASVYVDGKFMGKAYQNIYLEPKEYEVKAIYKNLRWEGKVKIEEEKVTSVQAKLKTSPLVRWLTIALIVIAVFVAVSVVVLAFWVVSKKLRERELKADAKAFEKKVEKIVEPEPEAVPAIIKDKLTIEISGPEHGLDIFVNDVNTAKRTPSQLTVNRGDFVYVEKIENGAWLVRGDEKYINFGKKEFADGYKLFVDWGEGDALIGYCFDKLITQQRFDELVKSSKSIKIIFSVDCKNITSLAALSNVVGLLVLNISGTSVSDILPLANLKSLKILDLSGTGVSNISVLANLEGLKSLILKDTPISDVGVLSKLTNLELLDLSSTQITKISALAALKGLKKLYLRNVPITDVIALSNLNNLEVLDLGGTKVSNIAPLIGLTKLKWLGLVGTPVSNIAPLAQLKELEWLGLGRTQVSDISPLANLSKLRVLLLGGSKISNLLPLSSLKDLEWLDVGGTNVSDVSYLSTLKELKMLYLVGTKVPKESVEKLQAQLPNCKIEYL